MSIFLVSTQALCFPQLSPPNLPKLSDYIPFPQNIDAIYAFGERDIYLYNFLRKAQACKELTLVARLLEITYSSAVTKGNFWLLSHLNPGRKHSFWRDITLPFSSNTFL